MKAIAVVGPTASGKTALSLRLAEELGGEIICCDSMQIYRGMDIGTAKATPAERAVCPHHLLDIADPREPFSAADYAQHAMDAVHRISQNGHLPIFCGGTGLYLDAVRTTRHTGTETTAHPALRAELTRLAETEEGRLSLYERLRAIDPAAAEATHPNNVRRVVRALEIFETTGRTKTELDRTAPQKNPALDVLVLGLTFDRRELMYARIDARVDAMMEAGLLDETRRLRDAGMLAAGTTASQAIGYKELLSHLAGEETYETAVLKLKTATRHYAKRQLTWFRKTEGIRWLTADKAGSLRTVQELTHDAMPLIRSFLA